MADYFGKYKGRGGPAIEPGIIQMMGSIGDEYAKGITALGKGIGDWRKAKEEQEKTEAANDLWTQVLQGPKSIEDPEAYGEAVLKDTEDRELAIEEARIAEREVDSVAEETASMKSRLDTKSYLGPKGYLQAGHPLSQVREITKEHTKFYNKLKSKDDALKRHSGKKSSAQSQIEAINSYLREEGVENRQTGSITPREPTDKEARDLKQANVDIQVANAGIKENKGPSYDTLSRYVTKLDSLRSLENEIPGSTVGFNRIERNAVNDWEFKESEAGRIVDERVRVYT
jgi:Mg2+ and Co2+ transporter CorA